MEVFSSLKKVGGPSSLLNEQQGASGVNEVKAVEVVALPRALVLLVLLRVFFFFLVCPLSLPLDPIVLPLYDDERGRLRLACASTATPPLYCGGTPLAEESIATTTRSLLHDSRGGKSYSNSVGWRETDISP